MAILIIIVKLQKLAVVWSQSDERTALQTPSCKEEQMECTKGETTKTLVGHRALDRSLVQFFRTAEEWKTGNIFISCEAIL